MPDPFEFDTQYEDAGVGYYEDDIHFDDYGDWGEEDFAEVDCTYIHHTPKAVLVDLGNDRRVWIPLSVIYEPPEFDYIDNQGEHTLLVAAWFAEKNGLS